MKSTFALAAASLLAISSAAPLEKRNDPPNGYGNDFEFPLANNFPNPGPKAIANVESLAGGALPSAPPNPGATGALDLSVIAVNEITEVAFFTELLYNITHEVTGYTVDNKSYVMDTIQAIKNQEELHALAANTILAAYNYTTVAPCRYSFPVDNYNDAIALAGTFTDLVLGALQSVEYDLATGDNPPLAQAVGSIIGQEGEQEGWFRYSQGKVPSSAPFLTNSNGYFAYNALMQLFIVPGSCPSTNPSALSAIPTYGALTLTNTLSAADTTATFSAAGTLNSTMYLTYMSGQNAPLSVAISDVKTAGDMTTFSASFPYESGNFSRGLTVAAVTTGKSYSDNVAVAKATKFGPGIIELD